MNERAERSTICSRQLVLISRHGCEDCFRKDEGSVFLLLHVGDGSAASLGPLDEVDSRLELVHRVEDDLEEIKLSKLEREVQN